MGTQGVSGPTAVVGLTADSSGFQTFAWEKRDGNDLREMQVSEGCFRVKEIEKVLGLRGSSGTQLRTAYVFQACFLT